MVDGSLGVTDGNDDSGINIGGVEIAQEDITAIDNTTIRMPMSGFCFVNNIKPQ